MKVMLCNLFIIIPKKTWYPVFIKMFFINLNTVTLFTQIKPKGRHMTKKYLFIQSYW